MSVKAKLKIILKADNIIVAESEDAQLWQKVLVIINSKSGLQDTNDLEDDKINNIIPNGKNPQPIKTFSKELGISEAELIGSCDPKLEVPYIHLDKHYWEALKRNTPKRGPKAIAPVQLAATLLALWKERLKLDPPTLKEVSSILLTINLTPKNANRAISNCEWLQFRGKSIVVNPAQSSKAVSIAKSYCLKKDPNK